jgi:predicted acylesterase/phospholipase RssA
VKYDLVFEGGGAKGTVFVGALQELEARGHVPGKIIGTSAGAITASLLAAGFKSEEILEVVTERLPSGKARLTELMDIPEKFDEWNIEQSWTKMLFQVVDIPFVPERIERKIDDKFIAALMKIPTYRQLFSFVERGGLYAGDYFLDWIREKLNSTGKGYGDMTMEEFYAKSKRHISLVGSNVTSKEMMVFNHNTSPDLPIIWAVRMSMSIPFLWQEVIWQSEWGHYRGRNIFGNKFVDGGVLSNFPIEYFLSDSSEVQDIMGDDKPNSPERVVGLLIDEALPVPGAYPDLDFGPQKDDVDTRWSVVSDRISDLITTLMTAHDNTTMVKYAECVCRLPAMGYGTTEFDMTPERVEFLVAAGRAALGEFLDAKKRRKKAKAAK